MPEPFLGEVKIVAFNFAPRGFAQCNGQLLPISQNQALFALLGNAVRRQRADHLRPARSAWSCPGARRPHRPQEWPGGRLRERDADDRADAVRTVTRVPRHCRRRRPTRRAMCPQGSLDAGVARYTNAGTPVVLNGSASVGGQPHNNMQPSLTLNFVIALQGIFPSRN